ncbi:MAG: retropepsin-like aspartic protease, partial [Cyanobacteria bacterium P01_H01_bin.152]
GKVVTTIKVTNFVDAVLAERGFIRSEQVRALSVDDVIVDTGASMLCLPANLIADLGLRYAGEVGTRTAIGAGTARIFQGVLLEIEGRTGTFDCLELPEGVDPLLGVIPQEQLGLEPDLQSQCLRVLPSTPKDSYISM